ncbi:MAG: oligosaccharide flippase family protein [Caldilineaceae bacterium]|nr:oligosaccharide flippase family protein [Caldilineaceae bacterium]
MLNRLRPYRQDIVAVLMLFGLALLWFAPTLAPRLSGRTLLPFDNLAGFEPWRSIYPNLIPHNDLLSDLVLQNAVWKEHVRRTLADGQFPLWNPQIFTGMPFMAGGQASVFYPLSLLFLILPLTAAYGWFTAVQIGLAGMGLYVFARTLGLRPPAALAGGVIYMFSGFLIASVVFTMFIAAAPWLPFLLAVIEIIIRKQEEKGTQSFRPIPYVFLGAAAIGFTVLAGHPELIYYTLMTAGAYSAVRLGAAWRRLKDQRLKIEDWGEQGSGADAADLDTQSSIFTLQSSGVTPRILKLAAWLLTMAVLGIALGGVQLLPLLELLPLNFRDGSATLAQVRGWAWPSRHVLTFALPNVFGNPSHHQWIDLWSLQRRLAMTNALGEVNHTIFWGIKNYVEGANYLGLMTWVLALLGFIAGVTRPAARRGFRAVHAWFFGGLAFLSLLFAFGTPLYALLYYGVPGWNQLHSPFRWVFPFTVSMAVLAAYGLDKWLMENSEYLIVNGAENRLSRADRPDHRATPPSPISQSPNLQSPISQSRISNLQSSIFNLSFLTRLLAAISAFTGLAVLLLVAVSYFLPATFIALGQRIVDGSDLAQMAFADGAMFWSYQAGNLLHFGVIALTGGALLWGMVRHKVREAGGAESGAKWSIWALALIALIFTDLWLAHGRFNPASPTAMDPRVDPPPAVRFLNEREGISDPQAPVSATPWRFTTFNLPGRKTFNANVGMYYGWQDVRGYDSVIPRQYAELMNRIAPQDNELLFNRIAPLYSNVAGDPYAILDNPLLDLLNVKYVITEQFIPNPTWTEIYRDASAGVYENREVMPRAFIVPEARVAPAGDQPLLESDLRDVVFIEEAPGDEAGLIRAGPQATQAQISRYTANDVFVDVNLSDRGWLVLTDAYFPGWKAYLRPFGAGENEEQEIAIHRADGAFRTVYLPESGQWTVRFVYSPMSFKLGLYASFLAGMTLLFLLLYWAWGKFYRPEATAGEVRTVAKNSLVPMTLNLANKAIDFAFAMLYVRLLGPDGTGKYFFVVALYGFFEIISRYGLGTLLTRDVAADKNRSSLYLTNVLSLRTLLWLVSLPVLAGVVWFYRNVGGWGAGGVENIGVQEVQAIAILAGAMLFANWADAFSSLFFAFEKMEYPAGLSSATALLKVTLGAAVLLLGWGFVGLAAVSLVTNIIQLIWLWAMVRSTLFKPEWQWDWPLQRRMMSVSGPLMLNHLLATIFWRIDVWILRPLAGAASVGLYSVGLKYLDGLNIIPSVFTMAVFPVMSRYAQREGGGLLRTYRVSVRLLLILSLPVAVTITFLATPLVWLVGGAQYIDVPTTMTLFGRTITFMGGSDLALRLIIWSIPIGFVNSVTQYVLISADQQRFLTKAFLIGVIFNVAGNLLLIPVAGYAGAAVITILSEFSLLFPFAYSVRRHVGALFWPGIVLPSLLAALFMIGGIWVLRRTGVNLFLATALGWPVYALGLLLTGALRGEEMAAVADALPLGPLRRLVRV